jgi:O-antigen/teichoic acid export membrane protein
MTRRRPATTGVASAVDPSVEPVRYRSLRNFAETGSALIVSQLLIGIAGVLTARALGPGARGLVGGVLAWSQTLPLIAIAGLNSAILLRVSGSRRSTGVALGNAIAYTLGLGSLVIVAAATALPGLLGHLGPHAHRLIFVALLLIPISLANELLFAVQVGLGRIRRYNISRLTSPALIFAGTVTAFAAGRITPTFVVVLTVASAALTTCLASVGLPWRELRLSMRTLREDVGFGLKVTVAGWLGLVNVRLDLMVMAAVVGASQVGYYGVANNAMLPVLSIAGAAAGLLTPAVVQLADGDSGEGPPNARQFRIIQTDARRYALASLAGGAALAAAAPVVIPLLFGRAFHPAVTLIWILIPGYVARALVTVLVAGAVGMRQPHIGNLAEGASLVVTAALLPFLLPRYEAVGAAITSTAAYVTAAGVAVLLFRRLANGLGANRQAPRPISGGI